MSKKIKENNHCSETENEIIYKKNKIEDFNLKSKYESNQDIIISPISDELESEESRLKQIKEDLDKIKDSVEIDEKLDYIEFEEKCKNKLIEFYKIINSNDDNNFGYKQLLEPFFDNKLIDDNYFENFNNKELIQNIKNSIIYKKNVIDKNDDSNNFTSFFKPLFFYSPKNNHELINNRGQQSYQNVGLGSIKIMLIITSLFFLFSSSVIYSKYNSVKSSNSEEKNKWFPGIHGLYSNEYKCISLNIDDLQNDYYSFDISCLDG